MTDSRLCCALRSQNLPRSRRRRSAAGRPVGRQQDATSCGLTVADRADLTDAPCALDEAEVEEKLASSATGATADYVASRIFNAAGVVVVLDEGVCQCWAVNHWGDAHDLRYAEVRLVLLGDINGGCRDSATGAVLGHEGSDGLAVGHRRRRVEEFVVLPHYRRDGRHDRGARHRARAG